MSLRGAIGRLLAPRLFNFTANMPCRRIDRAPGQRYLERYFLFRAFGVTVYLHRFVDADRDEEVHDHPFNALAVCLAGWYMEERLLSADPAPGAGGPRMKLRVIRPGSVNVIRGGGFGQGDFHRIVDAGRETWTLFLVGRRRSSWGFFRAVADGFHYVHFAQAIKQIPEPFPGAFKDADWHLRAPKGEDADRAPFGGL